MAILRAFSGLAGTPGSSFSLLTFFTHTLAESGAVADHRDHGDLPASLSLELRQVVVERAVARETHRRPIRRRDLRAERRGERPTERAGGPKVAMALVRQVEQRRGHRAGRAPTVRRRQHGDRTRAGRGRRHHVVTLRRYGDVGICVNGVAHGDIETVRNPFAGARTTLARSSVVRVKPCSMARQLRFQLRPRSRPFRLKL